MTKNPKIQTIDQRGDNYNPGLRIGFPADNRRLVCGLSGVDICPGGDGYESAIRRVRAKLRGHQNCVLLLANYAVEGWAEIE